MDYRNLGRSGLKVSPLCLGTMMFGGPTDETTSGRIIARAREAGINFIDTADAYNNGRSEEVVGRAIAAERSWWILATKLANPTGESPNDRGLSRRRAFQAVEASLSRLCIDVVDILYLHKEDHTTPLEETVHALADLVRQGKIRYFGVSNFRAWRVAEISRLCDMAGIDRPVRWSEGKAEGKSWSSVTESAGSFPQPRPANFLSSRSSRLRCRSVIRSESRRTSALVEPGFATTSCIRLRRSRLARLRWTLTSCRTAAHCT
jgi:aryl-alcohol dehydrogenase-like predicted oxidoreductase